MPSRSLPYWRLSAYYFFYFAFIGGFTPYFGLYLQSLSFSAWDIGVLMSQMQLMRLFGPYLWGMLADRLGQRMAIVRLTSVLAVLAFSVFFVADKFWAVFLVLASLSLFWVASLPLVETLTFDHLRENPAGYSRIRIWGSVGYIVVVLAVGALLDYVGLPVLLWVNLLLLVGIALNAFALPEVAHQRDVEQQLPVGAILRQPKVIGLLAACFAMAAAHGALNVFYSIFLADKGFSKSIVGVMWTIGVVAEIIVFFYMPGVMRRFNLRFILQVCFAVGALRFLLIGYGANSPTVLVIAQVMHGLTFGALHVAAIAAVNRWFPGSTRSRGQALYSSISFGAGGLLGGLVSGWIWERYGGELTFASCTLFALAGLAIVNYWIKRRDGVPAP